jgi:hypothetical protein
MSSYFEAVKHAFAANPVSSLETFGLTLHRGSHKNWQPVNCPICSDKSGSASISKENGFLRCHQCDRKLDLFRWWGEKHGLDDWESCKQVGQTLSVPLETITPNKRKRGRMMTKAMLKQVTTDLLEEPTAEPCRQFLRDRKLWSPQTLVQMGVGWLDGLLVFAQWFPNGELKKCFRTYATQSKKWSWVAGRGGNTMGFWPHAPLTNLATILLCEGEWDALTATIRAKTQEQDPPLCAFTWTGGAGSPITASAMPKDWAARQISVCYDNDTFQGPLMKHHKAPTDTKVREMLRRRTNLIHGIGGRMADAGMRVRLMAIPIDPAEQWGADLRDWIDKGRQVSELPSWPLSDVLLEVGDPKDVSHSEVFTADGELVRTVGTVATIENYSMSVPSETVINCPMNSKSACQNCGRPKLFQDGIIKWNERYHQLLNACMSVDPKRFIKDNVVGKPPSCTECENVHTSFTNGTHFTVSSPSADDGDGMQIYHCVAPMQPALSGDLIITGFAHQTKDSLGILATNIEQTDKPEVDIEQYVHELQRVTPHSATTSKEIIDHIESVAHDYANNVTKIYGRPEIHILAMLVAHSVIWFEIDGHRHRGWLDASCFGETRRGKSETIKRLFEHWQLGTSFTCMENFSRAGLTVGGAESGKKMRPGLWPKNNRKMLLLDEFHHMSMRGDNVMIHLQSARDEGKVSALKVYGDLKLQAAVRLITVGSSAATAARLSSAWASGKCSSRPTPPHWCLTPDRWFTSMMARWRPSMRRVSLCRHCMPPTPRKRLL